MLSIFEAAHTFWQFEKTIGLREAKQIQFYSFFKKNENSVFYDWQPHSTDLEIFDLRQISLDTRDFAIFKGRNNIAEASYLSERDFGDSDSLPVIRVRDKTVVYGINRLYNNLYHWIAQCIPAIDACSMMTGNEDFVIAVPEDSIFSAEGLRYLSHHNLAILETKNGNLYQFDRVIFSTICSGDASFRVSKSVRRTFGALSNAISTTCSLKGKIYVARTDAWSRRLLNEDALIEVMSSYGYEVIVPTSLSILEQSIKFKNSKVVVGPHGAGLSNMVYCDIDTIVYEILPSHYKNACFCNMAATARINYIADAFISNIEDKTPPNFRSWVADLEVIRKRLDEIENYLEIHKYNC